MERRRRISPELTSYLVILLALAAVGGLVWANLQYVEANPGGNDFLVHWVGTRAFMTEGLSPYSDEVALQIQQLAYGRPARPGEHELRVAYPLYSTLLFAPFALIPDYHWARAAWMTTLEVGAVLLLAASLNLVSWRPSTPVLALLALFSLLWYHTVRPLVNGNAVILIALLMTFALISVRRGWDEVAGVCLAFSTIKPQLSILLIAFVFFWAVTTGRWRIIASTLISVFVLILGAMVFIPDWPLQNLREVLRYPGYNPPGTLGAALYAMLPGVGRQLGWGVTAGLIALLIFEWRRAAGGEEPLFVWTACLTLVASQWIGIQTDPGNFIILMPALALVLAVWITRWGRLGRVMTVTSLVVLFFGLWALFLRTVSGPQSQQHPILFLPLPFFLLVGLYWARYWAIRSPLIIDGRTYRE